MSFTRTWLAFAAALSLPVASQAHRQWLLPSSTVLSNTDAWVTIDAAVSNELFYFDHVPLRVANLSVIGPDGGSLKAENIATGKYRTTFDVHLTQGGTYRIALINNTVFATWKHNGEAKMWRGTADSFKTEVPANAEGLKTSRMSSRVEVFVTAGKPSSRAISPTGVGLEMAPVTHPNDLVVGEPATFQMLQDGKPAGNLEVTLIPGGIRYRDQLNEVKLKTDDHGKFTTTFKTPGMYWMNATTGASGRPGGGPSNSGGPSAGSRGGSNGGPTGGGPNGGPSGGGPPMRMPAGDRASYTATFEVLPQ